MRDVSNTRHIFREISGIIADNDPIEARLDRIRILVEEHFSGAVLASEAQANQHPSLTAIASNLEHGYRLLVPSSGTANMDERDPRVAKALVDAYAFLSHQLLLEREREQARLKVRATNEMIMALLDLEHDTCDWQRITEGIIGDLFGARADVFSLSTQETTAPAVVRWALGVNQPLVLNDLPTQGITILDEGSPIFSLIVAIDRAGAQGITVSTTARSSFDETSLAIVEDCLRIYGAGLNLIDYLRSQPDRDSILTAILSNLDIGILGIADGGEVVFANRQAGDLLGHTPGELVRSMSSTISTQFEEYFSLLGSSPSPWLTTSTLLRKPSGKPQPASLSVRRIDDSQFVDYRYLVTLVDATRTHFELEEWRWHASHDPLTGLLNRTGLAESLRRLLNQPLVVLFMDINRFKAMNDLLGHRGGDRVITTVAQRLIGATKLSDIVARVGGDEFIVIAPVESNFRGLRRVAQRIANAITAEPIDVDDRQLAITVSMGAALETFHGSVDNLLGRADHAMYEAKQQGRSIHLARGDEEAISVETHLVDPNVFDVLRDRDADHIVAEELPWIRLRDHEPVGSDLFLTWRAPETPRDYAMRNHLRDEYNWLLLHHLLRRQSIVGAIGISPLAPGSVFFDRIERLSRAGYLNPAKVQIVLHSSELATDKEIEEACRLADRARRLGVSIALRWLSGEGGEVARVAALRPDQVQIDLGDWVNRPPSLKLANGFTAFAQAMDLEVAFIHVQGRFLDLLGSTRLREHLANALIRREHPD